jgi:hypothetical protein
MPELSGGFRPRKAKIRYMRRARTDLDVFDELLNKRPVSLGNNFNVAVIEILHVTVEAERLRVSGNKPSKTDSLHQPFDQDMSIYLHRARARCVGTQQKILGRIKKVKVSFPLDSEHA